MTTHQRMKPGVADRRLSQSGFTLIGDTFALRGGVPLPERTHLAFAFLHSNSHLRLGLCRSEQHF